MNYLNVENLTSHLRGLRCKRFIHNNGKNLYGKLDGMSDKGTILGYSSDDNVKEHILKQHRIM